VTGIRFSHRFRTQGGPCGRGRPVWHVAADGPTIPSSGEHVLIRRASQGAATGGESALCPALPEQAARPRHPDPCHRH